jgi:hypothetical protein
MNYFLWALLVAEVVPSAFSMRIVPNEQLTKKVMQHMGGADVGKQVTGSSLASVIVQRSGMCFDQAKCVHVCYEYQECVADFCMSTCKEQKECNDLCYSEASELFHDFAPQAHHPLNFANMSMLIVATPDQLVQEMKQDPLMEHMSNVGQLATSIVSKSQSCFDKSKCKFVCYEYQECVHNFCGDECKDQKDCVDVCYTQASELFHRFSPDVQYPIAFSNSTAKNGTAKAVAFLQNKAPEDDLAKEMTHDLEMNFNKIAPFGKEDTAKELQDHAAKTQDTLVDAVENAEVAEIKRAVFRALTRLRAATIKEFDTIARLETQAIDAYNDAHHYRAENPLTHLHEDEAPVETDKLKSFH